MPKRTITKFSVFVILVAAAALGLAACGRGVAGDKEPPAFDRSRSPFDSPEVVGNIESKEITESSGLAVSRCQTDIIWTHNDSGDGPFIFAINSKGRLLGTYQLPNAKNVDWEDIAEFKDAAGKCFVYIGETGNTNNNERSEQKIYRIPEPAVRESDADSSRKTPVSTEPAEVLAFSYPDARQDAETLMVHPVSGEIYIVTKHRTTPASVYKLEPAFDPAAVVTAAKIADITVPAIPNGFLTGGDIATDGRHMIICDYFAAYEYTCRTVRQISTRYGNKSRLWSILANGNKASLSRIRRTALRYLPAVKENRRP